MQFQKSITSDIFLNTYTYTDYESYSENFRKFDFYGETHKKRS